VTEVTDRLRRGLVALADEAPVSEDAWAEQERRLATGRVRRRGPLFAAAAAVVVLATAVPVAVLGHDDGAPPAGPRPPDTTVGPVVGEPPETTADGPIPLGDFTDLGRAWSAWVILERPPTSRPGGWSRLVCVVAVPAGRPATDPDRHPNSAGCLDEPSWPAGQPEPKVHTRAVLPAPNGPVASGPLPGLLLFLTVPTVASLDAREAYGASVPVRELVRTADLALFVGDFGQSTDGFGYTAYDSSGAVVEQAIT
jgi:hypothetical protein